MIAKTVNPERVKNHPVEITHMEAMTYESAIKNLDKAIGTACDGHTPVIITSQDNDPVVLISLEDFNSMQETLHLLSSPTNAKRLQRSIADVQVGKTYAVDLDAL